MKLLVAFEWVISEHPAHRKNEAFSNHHFPNDWRNALPDSAETGTWVAEHIWWSCIRKCILKIMKTNKVKLLFQTMQLNEKYILTCNHKGHFNASCVNQPIMHTLWHH